VIGAFRRDPYFVLRYNAANLAVGIVLLGSAVALFPERLRTTSPWWLVSLAPFLIPEFFVQLVGSALIVLAFGLTGGFAGRPWLAALPLAAGVFAYVSGMLMHNAAHRNIRPLWLNRLVGEACGFHQLGGYLVWSLVHLVHHRYADDPVYDPHPPGTKTFFRYMRTSFSGLITCMNRLYRESWVARDARYTGVWRLTGTLGSSARITRLLVLSYVLGPAGWACFYVPSYALLTFIYWHFNYVTHRPSAAGVMEIQDLDHNAFYRITNRLLGGFYYHRTHHEQPALFDPYRAQRRP
jgi:fatty acid desaturase